MNQPNGRCHRRTHFVPVTSRARYDAMTQTMTKAASWRYLILAVGLAAFLLAGCGPAAPGKDALGNSASKVTSTATTTTTEVIAPVDTTEETTESQTQGPVTAKVGETVAIDQNDGEATGTIQVQKAVTYKKTKAGYIGSPPKNGRYVQITVSAKSTKGVFSVNPTYFSLTNADGDVFGYADGNALYENGDGALNSADLNPGQKIRGTVTFDVPANAKTLEYAPFGQTIASWTLP